MEARLERARVREAELSPRLEEMKKFVLVMKILGRRRFRGRQNDLVWLCSLILALLVDFGHWACPVIPVFEDEIA